MAELKTKVNDADVNEFINKVTDGQKRDDSLTLLGMFKNVTDEEPKIWGSSIIGFSQYHYKSERTSQEGDWPLIGYSPRKQNLTLYIMNGFDDYGDLLGRLGKHKISKSCLYIKRLTDVDLIVLEQLVKKSFVAAKINYTQ